MTPLPRSFGFMHAEKFLQGTLFKTPNGLDAAGLYGEQTYESIAQLGTMTTDMAKVVEKIRELVK